MIFCIITIDCANYLLYVPVAALGMVAMGIFLDFYIWDMNSEMIFIDSTALEGDRTSFRYLLDNEGYTLNKVLHYSFGIHVGGMTLIINSIVCMCIFYTFCNGLGLCYVSIYTQCDPPKTESLSQPGYYPQYYFLSHIIIIGLV